MLRDLQMLLAAERRRALVSYLAWTIGYGILSGLAAALLVPAFSHLIQGDLPAVRRDLVWVAVAALVAAAANYVQAMKGFRVALEVMETLHLRLGDHVATLPLGWFDGDRPGRLARDATQGTYQVAGLFAHLLTPVVVGISSPATVLVTILIVDWRLGLICLACVPFLLLAFRFAAACTGRGDTLDHAAAVQSGNRVVDFARHQATLRAFGRGVSGYRPLEEAIDHQYVVARRSMWLSLTGIAAGGIVVQATLSVLLLAGTWRVLEGGLSAATAVAVMALSFRFSGPLAEVGEYAGVLRMVRQDLRRLTDVLRERPLPAPVDSHPVTTPGTVDFEEVDFGYAGDTPVLRQVSFSAPAHAVTALVGPSGSGKTTITRLIARFWDADRGVVRVGGVPVTDQAPGDLMAQLSLVFQDVYLFDDTLEANIRLGRPLATDAEVHRAAELAGVREIVERLPDGWATRVGEGGTRLSGGERQRVSVARALLKQAPIVLLDEATAALDPENERFVQRSLTELATHSTVIVIAHRLSTIATADQIVVLDDGQVVQSGRHEELLAAGGRYADFWASRQAAAGWRIGDADPEASSSQPLPSPTT